MPLALRSGDPAQPLPISCGQSLNHRRRPPIDVEFQNPGDHHRRPLVISILVTHIAQRRIATREEAAAIAALLLNDPVSAAVLADH